MRELKAKFSSNDFGTYERSSFRIRKSSQTKSDLKLKLPIKQDLMDGKAAQSTRRELEKLETIGEDDVPSGLNKRGSKESFIRS